jgi:hypothetical protein
LQDFDEDALSFENYISSLVPVSILFSALELCINSCGHVYGAMVLHLLGLYTLIQRLKVDLIKFRVISSIFLPDLQFELSSMMLEIGPLAMTNLTSILS